MVAFPALLYGSSDALGSEAIQLLGYVAGGIGVVLSYYAAALYLPMARRALQEANARRETTSVDAPGGSPR
jgi:hypothetical protein